VSTRPTTRYIYVLLHDVLESKDSGSLRLAAVYCNSVHYYNEVFWNASCVISICYDYRFCLLGAYFNTIWKKQTITFEYSFLTQQCWIVRNKLSVFWHHKANQASLLFLGMAKETVMDVARQLAPGHGRWISGFKLLTIYTRKHVLQDVSTLSIYPAHLLWHVALGVG
jgi:hypothetical protein